MAGNKITGRAIGFVVAAFLLLVAVQIWWQRAEEEGKADEEEPAIKVSGLEIEGREGQVRVEGEDAAAAKTRQRLRRRELERQIELLRTGDATERRAAAFRLVFIADESAVDALLAGLKDPDPKVADRCAKALIRVWRRSDSVAARRLLARAVQAYEAGRTEEAMEALEQAAELDEDISDLYRLRAEMWLVKSRPEQALADCKKTVRVEQNHFRAHYVMARCYLEMHENQKALESVTEALRIYTHFQEAQELKKKILALKEGAKSSKGAGRLPQPGY